MTVEDRQPRGRWVSNPEPNDAAVVDRLVSDRAEPMFLSVQAVAEMLRVSSATVRAWIAKGEGPPAMRFGKQIRYRPERVMEWVQEQEGDHR